jgi:hypothetical protein
MKRSKKRTKINLRPGRDQQTGRPRQPKKQLSLPERLIQASDALYHERGGEYLDDSIEALHATIKLYRQEVKRAAEWKDDKRFPWKVTPGAVNRATVLLDRYLEKRNALRDECYQIARETIEQVMQTETRQESEPERSGQPDAAPDTNSVDHAMRTGDGQMEPGVRGGNPGMAAAVPDAMRKAG